MSAADEREQLAEGSLISHLLELRNRLLKAVIAVTVLFVLDRLAAAGIPVDVVFRQGVEVLGVGE